MNRKIKDLTKNTFLFAISSFGTKILSFLLVPLYTNVLTTSEYGIADLLSTTTTLLIVVFTINIADGVLIFAMDKKCNQDKVLALGLKVILLGSILLFAIFGICYLLRIFSWPMYYFVFVEIFFICSAFYQVFSNFLRAIDKVNQVAIAGVLSSIVYIVCNIFFLLVMKIGLNGYLISTVAGPLIGALYCFCVAKKSIYSLVKEKVDSKQVIDILKYCFPLIFNSIALWVNGCLDRYFVTYFCDVDQNGIYSVANKIPIILSTIYTVFSQAWTLSAVKEFDKEDRDGFFSKTYEMYNAVMIISCSVLVLLNIPIAKILYAKEFFVAWNYSSVLLLGIFFNSLTAFIGSFFSATKKSSILAYTTVISAAINTILNIILIPVWGVQGAAIATTVSLFAMWFIRMIKLKDLVRIKVNWIKSGVVYFLLVVQVVLEHFENHMYFLQCIIVFTIIIFMIKPFIQIMKKFMGKFFSKDIR